MTTGRPIRRMDHLPAILRGLAALWAQVTGSAVAVSLIFGPFLPLAVVALFLSLFLPIVALYLWGRALDEQLGWLRNEDEGHW